MATHPQLIDIAGAVADLTEIDWAALEAGVGNPLERAALARLRLLDKIVRACAHVAEQSAAGDLSVATGLAPPEAPLTTWGPFTLHERVGHGSFGDVYRAHERRLDRIVALKLLRRQEGPNTIASEVIEEGRLLARVRHPNVVTVHGAEQIDGRVGMWMEFIGGRTLEEDLKATGPLPPSEVVAIGLTLCGALAAVHEAGLLHRDLKAQNVLRASDGRIILTDFGAGRAMAGEAGDGRQEMAGTPLYLAPEVLTGRPASIASEIYGLGVLLYHLATGSFPVRGRTLRELRDAHAKDERVRIGAYRDKLPTPLVSVIDRAVDPDAAKRFASVGAFHRALERAVPPARSMRRWLTAATLVIVGIVGVYLVATRPPLHVLSQSRVYRRTRSPALAAIVVRANRVYYTEDGAVYSTVVGEQTSQKINDAWSAFDIVDVDPTGTEFLALGKSAEVGGPQVWILSTASGHTRRIADLKCNDAKWSPDGTRLACVRDETGFTVVNADGSASTLLPVPAGTRSVQWPHWSPDGTRLRFNAPTVDGEVRNDAIWEVNADGSGLHQILAGWHAPNGICCGSWTPDGEYYLFAARSNESQRTDLWAIRERRTLLDWTIGKPMQLTSGPETFESRVLSTEPRDQIVVVGSEHSGELVALSLPDRNFVRYDGRLPAGTWFSWSPDRSSVVYISYPEKKLWRADADGRNGRALIDSPVEMDGSVWSPDGRLISFIGRLNGVHRKIFLVPPDGSRPYPISQEDVDQGIPTWSPDGRWLAFGDSPERFGNPSGTEVLHLYDVEQRRFSEVPHSRGLWTCRWSPDGRSLLALTIKAPYMIKIYDFEKKTWRDLPGAHHVNNPSWSHNSEFIYYDTASGPRELRRVRVSDGRVDTLRTLMDYAVVAMWAGLDPEDRPLVLHNTGNIDIYALKIGR